METANNIGFIFAKNDNRLTTASDHMSSASSIEQGFGPDGLGILSISDVPGYLSLRRQLLHLSGLEPGHFLTAFRLASLPEEVKRTLEDPHSRYNFGWSHGKEKLESGKPDTMKGSFYANSILDIPTTDAALIQRYPSYCQPNIWPGDALPELEPGFQRGLYIKLSSKYTIWHLRRNNFST